MKVLVTGGTGFVGGHLLRRLVRNHRVTCLVRSTSDVSRISHLPISIVEETDYGQYDIVYHIAGVLGDKKLPMSVYILGNVSLTQDIVSQMTSDQRLVFSSTIWVENYTHEYGETKLRAEEIIQKSGIPYYILRSGFVYGEEDLHHLPLFKIVNKLGGFTPIMGGGDTLIAPTYIKDLIDELVKEKDGLYRVCSQVVTTEAFIQAIASALGKKKPFIRVRYVPKMLRELAKWDFFTVERTADEIEGATTLGVGLRNTVRWYRENGLL